ncbi:TPA: hypothetical protein I3946_000778 [Enterobacter cloacae]|nr:hypothetical protein [Enterobacter cloacae]HBC2536038.1 hypothetical protein [Enterobacter cloacae]HBC2543921.1 hypothetical protein [Enterobacter cloacae]
MKKADRIPLQKLVDYGCIVCRNLGFGYSPAQIHHLRKGCGTGQRSALKRSIPLCPLHQRSGGYGIVIHAGQRKWEKNYGSEEALFE